MNSSAVHPSVDGAATASNEYLLQIGQLSRSFGETRALVSATLMVKAGEIHALAGENGSGKSTLIKILSGALPPGGGTISWRGQPLRLRTPAAAHSYGISTVFQETLVVPELDIVDNIYLGTDGIVRHGHGRADQPSGARAALEAIGVEGLDVNRPLWSLSLAERQLVTIARAIVRPWQLLILDEGTSALDASQRDRLFAYLRHECATGKSVLFTSHRMDEVFDLASKISVLRSGTTVAELAVADVTHYDVLAQMSGRESTERPRESDAAADARIFEHRDLVLTTDELVLRPSSAPISIGVRHGEILGVAGLEGHGQAEFAACMCGLGRPESGRVTVLDEEQHWRSIRSYAEANRYGVRYVPRDRRHEGLFAPLSILENFSVASYGQLNRGGVLQRGAAKRRFAQFAESSRLVAGRSSNPITTLSGGNQQKILLGRWTAMSPRVLVLNDPLRGVDANTKEEFYGYFRRLAADGVTIVFLSTEILELLTISDRIAVFREGSVNRVLPAAGTTETDIVSAMFGHDVEAGS